LHPAPRETLANGVPKMIFTDPDGSGSAALRRNRVEARF
jgi:hypothetical protein